MKKSEIKRRVELPLSSPPYSTYHYQGSGGAIINDNLSIINWYLSNALLLSCTRDFFVGRTTPELEVVGAKWLENPYFDVYEIPFNFSKGETNKIIKNILNEGYYVIFEGVDDYFIDGKSWSGELHFYHDGLICGYDDLDETYCIYAYDKNWIYKKFWTPQLGFDKGRRYMCALGRCGRIYAVRPRSEKVEFLWRTAYEQIKKYSSTRMEQYTDDVEGRVYGIAVLEYMAAYLDKLLVGEIPYERMDRRIFRLIWEHKKVMRESISKIESELCIDKVTSRKYDDFVEIANEIRMLYALYHKKRRDSLIPVIQKKVMKLRDDEKKALDEFIERIEDKTKNEVVEVY